MLLIWFYLVHFMLFFVHFLRIWGEVGAAGSSHLPEAGVGAPAISLRLQVLIPGKASRVFLVPKEVDFVGFGVAGDIWGA